MKIYFSPHLSCPARPPTLPGDGGGSGRYYYMKQNQTTCRVVSCRVGVVLVSCRVVSKKQPLAVDHLARASMKSAASRIESCELQLPH